MDNNHMRRATLTANKINDKRNFSTQISETHWGLSAEME